MTSLGFDEQPVRRVQLRPGAVFDPDAWPYSLPAVAQLLRLGLDLGPGVTFLVGENGSGKSTIVEAIAAAVGLNPEGGSRNARHTTRASESPLHEILQLVRSARGPKWGYFLRAETMHGLYTYLEEVGPGPRSSPVVLHERSHGESFLDVLLEHFSQPGFYLLDEPESALSFSSCLALVGVLDELVRIGGQVVCASHSPLLTAMPGAAILELGPEGFEPKKWEELELVDHWRRYLAQPQAYLRHVLG